MFAFNLHNLVGVNKKDPNIHREKLKWLESCNRRGLRMFGQGATLRTGFAFTIFQTPRQVAAMWQEGGWTPQEVADRFHDVLGQHLQSVGMPAHPLLGKQNADKKE